MGKNFKYWTITRKETVFCNNRDSDRVCTITGQSCDEVDLHCKYYEEKIEEEE